MAQTSKQKPVEQPEPSRPLREALEQGLQSPDQGRRISVELRVSGGQASRRYAFHFRAGGDQEAQAELRCGLSGRQGEAKDVRLHEGEWTSLLREILDSGVLDLPEEPPRFLPDTVVGLLEISDGESTRWLYFAADEDQASVQGKRPPPPLTSVVETIYRLAGRMMNLPSVRP